ncbi:Vacuolar protein sorting-associated protein 53, variant 2, partial [Bonamia ostreae]
KIEQISEERPLEMLTLILKTTSYIEEIVLQLKKRIFKDCQKINFKTDFDFHKLEEINIKLANNTLNNISDLINEKCEPILRETNKLNLAKLKTLGEPSRFTEALSVIIERKFVILRQNLVTEHYLIFCGRFLAKFYQIFNDFIQNCRMVRKIGAQQLLLDHYTIKSHIQRNILSSDEQTSDNLLKKIILAKSENLEKKLKLLSSEEFSVKKFCQFFPTFGKTGLLIFNKIDQNSINICKK